MPLNHLTKFSVVAPKCILRADKIEAKTFSYKLLDSCEFSASVCVVVLMVVVGIYCYLKNYLYYMITQLVIKMI